MKLLVGVALVPLLLGCSSARGHECPRTGACAAHPRAALADVVEIPADTPGWLIHDARLFARSLGDPHPRKIRITLGRFDVIALRGRFVCTKCFGIYTAKSKYPSGTFARYVIDPRTRTVDTFNLGG